MCVRECSWQLRVASEGELAGGRTGDEPRRLGKLVILESRGGWVCAARIAQLCRGATRLVRLRQRMPCSGGFEIVPLWFLRREPSLSFAKRRAPISTSDWYAQQCLLDKARTGRGVSPVVRKKEGGKERRAPFNFALVCSTNTGATRGAGQQKTMKRRKTTKNNGKAGLNQNQRKRGCPLIFGHPSQFLFVRLLLHLFVCSTKKTWRRPLF